MKKRIEFDWTHKVPDAGIRCVTTVDWELTIPDGHEVMITAQNKFGTAKPGQPSTVGVPKEVLLQIADEIRARENG